MLSKDRRDGRRFNDSLAASAIYTVILRCEPLRRASKDDSEKSVAHPSRRAQVRAPQDDGGICGFGLAAAPVGYPRKILGDDIPIAFRLEIVFLQGAVFGRPRDEGGL